MSTSPSSLQKASGSSSILDAPMESTCKCCLTLNQDHVSHLSSVGAVCLTVCFISCCSRVEPTEEGDYQICFDNTFSRFSEKMVFFEIIIEGQGGDVGGDDEWVGLEEPDGSLLEYKLEDIRVRCVSVV